MKKSWLASKIMDETWIQAKYFDGLAAHNPPKWVAKFAAQSAAARQHLSLVADQPYGPHPRQRYDFYPASGVGTAPMLVYFHGGYWQRGCKEDWAFIADCWTRLGANILIPNYRIAPHGMLRDMDEDMQLLMRHINENSLSLQTIPGQVVVSGHSAGGHLGALAASHAPDIVRATCLVSGLFDLRPLVGSEAGEAISLSEEVAARLSPLLIPPARTPQHLFVGAEETGAFIAQSKAFFQMRSGFGLESSITLVPDAHHFSILSGFGDTESALGKVLRASLAL